MEESNNGQQMREYGSSPSWMPPEKSEDVCDRARSIHIVFVGKSSRWRENDVGEYPAAAADFSYAMTPQPDHTRSGPARDRLTNFGGHPGCTGHRETPSLTAGRLREGGNPWPLTQETSQVRCSWVPACAGTTLRLARPRLPCRNRRSRRLVTQRCLIASGEH